jgi:small subunit ribosomal protein S2|uniref:Small ribosomal subunit protein uS2c n=2 Tax=Chrysochromulina TaxID=35140 RepID=A0A075DWR8_9EUKA|nr:30S ribosomal protein S2 [Chrysochromulina parva]AHY04315.2 30S ribosomal protein S2 [Chrysochromulina tobinii]AUS84342.1 30S ribosomal protein S2 [Chrysochromulina parva]
MTLVTLGELLDAGVHFGHQSSRWNPKMFPYIYTEQNGIHVIDLVQTARLLSHAYNYVQKAAKEGKTFLFIGTKRQAKNIIAEEATKCGSFFVDNRWLGGTLTNWSTVQGRVDYLKDLNQREASGELDRLPKKEAALLRREHDKLKNNLGGLTEMVQVPDIAIVVDPKRESTAIAECRKLGITVIAILDTNCDPGMVDIPIPANDDAVRSIKLIISTLSDAIITGKQTSV